MPPAPVREPLTYKFSDTPSFLILAHIRRDGAARRDTIKAVMPCMGNGWIKLHRKFKGHWLYDAKPYDNCHAWLDILLSVNHEDRKVLFDGQLTLVKAGQMITSLSKLTERWGWENRSKTRRFLELLKSDGMVELRRNNNGTLLTVVNWAFYQSCETQTEQSRNTGETQNDTNKNDKNDKKLTDDNTRAREFGRAVAHYQDKIAPTLSGVALEELRMYTDALNADLVIVGIDRAIDANVYRWSYIKSILQSWVKSGVKTLDDVRRADAEWDRSKSGATAKQAGESKSFSQIIQEAKESGKL